MSDILIAPFPWFGGKRRVAGVVWQRLGDVDLYVEPFAGSLAVLLGRPHPPRRETVNDYDGYLVNFWRAVQADPDAVAYYADWPVNEIDLTARHLWLTTNGRERLERLFGDPAYYDAQTAGWWVWGLSAWIGSEWCSGRGPWISVNGRLTRRTSPAQPGVSRRRPHLTHPCGIHCLVDDEPTAETAAEDDIPASRRGIQVYLRRLAQRLRHVVVTCGDWSRVTTNGALAHGDPIGVFLDPPYDSTLRASDCYNTDAVFGQISTAVRAWALTNGADPRLRVALCGYEGEHNVLEQHGWQKYGWTASRAYGCANAVTANATNRALERIWFSPHCLPAPSARPTLMSALWSGLFDQEQEGSDVPGRDFAP